MKPLKNYLLIIGLLLAAISCEKVEDLPYYDNGSPVTLSASSTAIAAAPGDSLNNVVTFSWTSPGYATDSASYKFILEIDSAGRNFSKKITQTIMGGLNASLTGKELNNILLNYAFSPGVPYDMDVRVVSSYSNNNEQYVSNVVNLSVTPYNDPSALTTEKTSVTPALATASQPSNKFSWAPAFNGYTGTVSYVLQYDTATRNFNQFTMDEIPEESAIYRKTLTDGEIKETALNSEIKGGESGKVDYRIKATTA